MSGPWHDYIAGKSQARKPLGGDAMSEMIEDLTRLARPALIVAAQRRTLLTYKELGAAIGVTGVGLSHHLRYVLDRLSEQCAAEGMPSLASLVVNSSTGAPGAGWTDGAVPWHAEVQQVFRRWGDSDRLSRAT
ncbi:hypothetical protein GCM10009743_23080 [Kribbella swartbergensis]